VLIDGEEKAAGKLTNGSTFDPPLRPAAEIPDPDDKKPDGWDEQEE
jgi:hypothetical protein